jgi:hypothetical protein
MVVKKEQEVDFPAFSIWVAGSHYFKAGFTLCVSLVIHTRDYDPGLQKRRRFVPQKAWNIANCTTSLITDQSKFGQAIRPANSAACSPTMTYIISSNSASLFFKCLVYVLSKYLAM